MDDFDLPDLLGAGAPEADPDTLARIVRRQGRLRVRRARRVASAVVVVALAGAGVGVGLSSVPHNTLAAGGRNGALVGSAQSPTGLEWAKDSPAGTTESAGPGVFGWLGSSGFYASSATATSSGRQRLPAESPRAALVGPGLATSLPAVCTRRGCGPVFTGESLKRLFERTVSGVRIDVWLERYDLATGKASPDGPVTGATAGDHAGAGSGAGSASSGAGSGPGSGAGSAGSGGNSGQGAGVPAPPAAGTSASLPERVALPCLSPTELVVTVSRGGSTASLAVPGAASDRPFSVVASAGVYLAGDEVVLAVAHTSTSVSTVSSVFPGGAEDEMVPVDGWSVLAHSVSRPLSLSAAGAVTLVAASGSGATLERVKLPATGSLGTAAAGTCRYWVGATSPIAMPPQSSPVPSAGSSPSGSPGSSPMTGGEHG